MIDVCCVGNYVLNGRTNLIFHFFEKFFGKFTGVFWEGGTLRNQCDLLAKVVVSCPDVLVWLVSVFFELLQNTEVAFACSNFFFSECSFILMSECVKFLFSSLKVCVPFTELGVVVTD